MTRRAAAAVFVVMCLCRGAPGERWLIERGEATDLAPGNSWVPAACELLLRSKLSELRGVRLISKEDVKSDVATLELNRLSSASGKVRVRLGEFARAGGLLVIEPPDGRGADLKLRVINLTQADRERTLSVELKLDDVHDIEAHMTMIALEWARFLGRAPSPREVARMNRPRGLTRDALVALAKGTDAKADAERGLFFKQATMLAKEAPLAWYLHARQLHASGRTLEAISAYRSAVRLDGEQVATHYDLGNAFFDEKRYDEAVQEYTRAIALDASHAPSHENLLRALGMQELPPEEVLAKYREVTAACEQQPVVHLQVGRLLMERGKHAEAVASLRRAVELDHDDAIARYNLALALERLGKENEAFYEYKEAIRFAPNYAKAYNNVAFLYEKKDKQRLALFYYQQAVKYAPDYALAWNNLGILYGKRGMHRLELEAFRTQVKLTPADPVAYFNVGIALHRRRQYAPAIASYKKALELAGDDKPAHWHLALAYEHEQLWNLANRHWKKVLELNPTDEERKTAERHIGENEKR